MAIGNETVTVAVCDACGKRTYGDPGKQPAVVSGEATDRTAAEKTAKWSACGPSHVGKAVNEAIKKANVATIKPAWSAGN